jgi:hypothetical protein
LLGPVALLLGGLLVQLEERAHRGCLRSAAAHIDAAGVVREDRWRIGAHTQALRFNRRDDREHEQDVSVELPNRSPAG